MIAATYKSSRGDEGNGKYVKFNSFSSPESINSEVDCYADGYASRSALEITSGTTHNRFVSMDANNEAPLSSAPCYEGKVTDDIICSASVHEKSPCQTTNSGSEEEEQEEEAAPGNVTFANPKNFSERLMTVLESNVSPEGFWWVADGKAIALHTKYLKKSAGLLKTHLKVSEYTTMIRNMSRW